MKYFIDTEFHEYKKKVWFSKPVDTIELISIGIASEDFREYYAISKEFDIKAAWKNEWLRENVLKPIYDEHIERLMKSLTKFQSILHDLLMFNSLKKFNLKTMKLIFAEYGKTRKELANEIIEFTQGNVSDTKAPLQIEGGDTSIEFYAYYADYDWVVFCWIFGRMIDLPESFPMYCRDLKQIMDEKRDTGVSFEKHPSYPTQENEHNALDDALWNRKLFKFLNRLE